MTVSEIKGLSERTKRCVQCGAAFVGGKRAQFCSGACRVAAFRVRHPERKRRESLPTRSEGE